MYKLLWIGAFACTIQLPHQLVTFHLLGFNIQTVAVLSLQRPSVNTGQNNTAKKFKTSKGKITSCLTNADDIGSLEQH